MGDFDVECTFEQVKENMPFLLEEAKRRLSEIAQDKTILKSAVEAQIMCLENDMHDYEIQEFSLVFMGKKGCGKTSTIVNLCKLLPEELKDLGPGRTTSLDKATLLPVGSAGTTAAEMMEIVQVPAGKGIYFEIECCTREELEDQIKDFVEIQYITEMEAFRLAHPGDLEEKPKYEKVAMSPEIKRYVENMCREAIRKKSLEGRPDYPMQEKDGKTVHMELGELVRHWFRLENEREGFFATGEVMPEKVKRITDLVLEELIGELVEAKPDEKDGIHLRIDNDEDGAGRHFIRMTTLKLNNGTYRLKDGRGLTIVRKIRLCVPEDELPLGLNDQDGKYRITRVVDTRGYGKLDGTRTDLQNYLGRTDHVNLFAEQYTDCPDGNVEVVRDILRNHLKAHFRTGLDAVLLNWKSGEPSGDMGNKDVDEEEDIFFDVEIDEHDYVCKRKKQISDFLLRSRLRMKPENVLDYNPITGYKLVREKGNKVVAYDKEAAEAERKYLKAQIFRVIERNRAELMNRIRENYRLLKFFTENGDISVLANKEEFIEEYYRYSRDLIDKVRAEIQKVPFEKYYEQKLCGFYGRQYEALSRHKGRYRAGEVSIFDINAQLQEYYQRHIGVFQERLTRKLEEIRKETEGARDGKELLRFLANYQDSMIYGLSQYQDEFHEDLQAALKDTDSYGIFSHVWEETGLEGGRGGYGVNARIRDLLIAQINKETVGFGGNFSKRSREIEKEVCDRIVKIVDNSFGREK